MTWLLETASFTPHGFCLAYDPDLLTWSIIGDGLTAAAYAWIPLQLLLVLWRNARGERIVLTDRPGMLALFGSFILLCGSTHVLHIVTLFVPVYWLQAVMTMATGLVSIMTAGMLQWVFRPEARVAGHELRNVQQQHDDLLILLGRITGGAISIEQARAIAARLHPAGRSKPAG